MKISICIPTYEMKGQGAHYLDHSFSILDRQTYREFEVVISDHSTTTVIEEVCKKWSSKLDIKHFYNEDGRGVSSSNINAAMKHATGDVIKILFQDDFLYDNTSLEVMLYHLIENNNRWLITACCHSRDDLSFYNPFYPKYHDSIQYGNNTISSPSVLMFYNHDLTFFDENLFWLMDVEYYKRMYDKFGLPVICNYITVVNREHDNQVSNINVTNDVRNREYSYVEEKYKKNKKLDLSNITLLAVTSVRLEDHIKALEYSSKEIKFGAIKIISDIKPTDLPYGITHEYIEPMHNINEWNYAVIYKLSKYVDTDFMILIHDDGFIINPDSWREEFLDYDYIGAPWPIPNDDYSYRDVNGELIRVGNSVSLRSKKLIDLPIKLNLEWKPFHGFYSEDGFICVNYRHKYLEEGCKFADIHVAKYFSHETPLPETQGIPPFAFHGKYSPYRKLLEK